MSEASVQLQRWLNKTQESKSLLKEIQYILNV